MIKRDSVLGIRINNPLCLRYSPYNRWNGQLGDYKGFCKFSSLRFGVRAAVFVLMKYVFHYHLFTVQAIIKRFAPNSDFNDTDKYIDLVNNDLRFYKKSKFQEKFRQMVLSMACVECGYFNLGYFLDNKFLSLVDDAINEYVQNVLKPKFGTSSLDSILYQVASSLVPDSDLCLCYDPQSDIPF